MCAVRESRDARSAGVLVDLLETFWTSPDALETDISGPKKISPQAERAPFVPQPASSISASAAGRTMKRGASLATLQAPVKTGPNDLPGFSDIGMLLEIVQPPIELCLLSVGEGDLG